MSSGSNNLRIGTDRAMAGLLAELNERVRQLERSMPGSGGGGSVLAPFTIGGVSLGGLGEDVDLTDLSAHLARLDADVAALEASVEALPRGYIGQAATASLQAAIGTSPTSLNNLAVTLVAEAGRRYLVEGTINFRKLTGGGICYFEIYNETSATTLHRGFGTWGALEYGTLNIDWSHVPGAGSVTYRLRAYVSNDTMEVNTLGSSPHISLVRVTDIGI